MNSLRLNSNWRSILWILKNSSTVDTDTPLPYVYLDDKNVPGGDLDKFCRKNWSRFAFDYDPTNNFYIWPIGSNSTAEELVEAINKRFPHCASLVNKTPAEVHNLYFDDSNDLDLSF
jgi:hypothetical protein